MAEKRAIKATRKPKTYGYVRLITPKQSADDQVAQLKKLGAMRVVVEPYTVAHDRHISFDRLTWKMLPGDSLLVADLATLAPGLAKAVEILENLVGRRISVRVLAIGVFAADEDGQPTAETQGYLRALHAAAKLIDEQKLEKRQRARKILAKTDEDYSEGAPRKGEQFPLSTVLSYLGEGHTRKEAAKQFSISVRTVDRRIAEERKKLQQLPKGTVLDCLYFKMLHTDDRFVVGTADEDVVVKTPYNADFVNYCRGRDGTWLADQKLWVFVKSQVPDLDDVLFDYYHNDPHLVDKYSVKFRADAPHKVDIDGCLWKYPTGSTAFRASRDSLVKLDERTHRVGGGAWFLRVPEGEKVEPSWTGEPPILRMVLTDEEYLKIPVGQRGDFPLSTWDGEPVHEFDQVKLYHYLHGGPYLAKRRAAFAEKIKKIEIR